MTDWQPGDRVRTDSGFRAHLVRSVEVLPGGRGIVVTLACGATTRDARVALPSTLLCQRCARSAP